MLHLILFLSLFFNVGCINKTVKNDSDTYWLGCSNEIGEHPCNFTLEDQRGVIVSLYNFYGSPIVLDFSTGWCGFCGIAAEEAQAVQDKYASYGLVYITVMIEDHRGKDPDSEFCKAWADTFGILSAPVLAGSDDLVNDDPKLGWQISGYPSFYFIDEEMIVNGAVVGFGPSQIDEQINLLFN